MKIKKSLAAQPPASPPPVGAERVHAYARGVLADPSTAGWMVRAAAQRHLDDLTQAHKRGLVWLAHRAEAAINFFEQVLHLEEDKPFKLEPFQAFIVGSLYGWWTVDRDRTPDISPALIASLHQVTQGGPDAPGVKLPPLHRRFRFFYGEIGKGNGKTPLAAGLGLMHLEMAFDPRPEVYSAAAAREQARICFDDASAMVEASPRLRDHVAALTGSITIASRGARFIPLSSEDRGQHGKRVSFASLDEVHAHESARMVRAMVAGTKNCRNALIALVTNSPKDNRSICAQYRGTAVRILRRRVQRDNFFAFVCTLDPCPKCRERNFDQPDLKCRACDQFDDPLKWIKANPGLGTICRRSYVAERVELGKTQPSELPDVLQLNLCFCGQNAAGWANMEQWNKACLAPAAERDIAHFAGRRAALAMDAANRVDVTSLVAVIERDPGAGKVDPARLSGLALKLLKDSTARRRAAAEDEIAAATQADTDLPAAEAGEGEAPEFTLFSSGGYMVFAWHFVPSAMVHHANNANREAFEKWAAAGQLVVTPGGITDFGAIMRKIKELAALLQVVRFQCDPRELGLFMQRLGAQDWCSFEVVEVSQNSAMISQPMKLLEALIVEGLIRHNGDEPLAWMLGNVVQKTSSSGGPLKYYYPTKPTDSAKIDAAVALIMGVDGILRTSEQPVGDAFVVGLG